MEPKQLSQAFYVRRLHKEDLEEIYALSCGNPIFYQYHPPFVTRESILQDMQALPSHKSKDDKLYVGFFKEQTLVAVMDLILHYPVEKTAFIGLFMMHAQYQKKGIGSSLLKEIRSSLTELGFEKIRLAVDKGNPQSYAFWSKNNFHRISEDAYIIMEASLENNQ